MTILQTLAVFVGIPALIYALIAVFTVIPGRGKHPRYRPGQPWEYPNQWWSGDQPIVTAATVETRSIHGGGAHGSW